MARQGEVGKRHPEKSSPSHLVCVAPRLSKAIRANLLDRAAAFAKLSGEFRIVTFIDELEGANFGNRKIESWRSAIGTAAYEEAWRRAYLIADDFVALITGGLRKLLVPYYHTIADRAHQFLVLEALLASSETPVFAIVVAPPKPPFAGIPPVEIIMSYSLADAARILGRRIAYVGRAFGRRALRLPRRTTQGASANARRDPSSPTRLPAPGVLIAVQEGVAAVNSPSALTVAQDLREQACDAVILTPNRAIAERAAAEGLQVLCPVELTPAIVRPKWIAFGLACRRELRALAENGGLNRQLRHVSASLLQDLPLWVSLHAAAWEMLDRRHNRVAPIGVGLLVNEGTPISGLALAWLRENGLPDLGYWPALLGNRPDCNYFPASHHLVYGEQLERRTWSLGLPTDSVECVGSVNFDSATGRDRQRDITYVHTLLPKWTPGDHLVVVASEALPEPFEELGPVLLSLATLDNVAIALKIHPADSVETFRHYLQKTGLSDRVALLARCDLDALLNAAELLICVLSNIIVNAAILGTPTLICDFSNKRAPLDFVAEGLCLGCLSPDRLTDMLPAILPGGPLRQAALSLLQPGLRSFNNPADGHSAARISAVLRARLASSKE